MESKNDKLEPLQICRGKIINMENFDESFSINIAKDISNISAEIYVSDNSYQEWLRDLEVSKRNKKIEKILSKLNEGH